MNVQIKTDEQLRQEKAAAEDLLKRTPETPEEKDALHCYAAKCTEAVDLLHAEKPKAAPAGRFEEMKLAIEALGGGNTVLLDDLGLPSVMVAVPLMRLCDLYAMDSTAIHPAFIVNGSVKQVVYISKYMNCVAHDRAYSLPMRDPHVFFNFDDGVRFCLNKGRGWHLLTNAEWMAVAQWSKRNGTRPHGNTDRGMYHAAPWEKGVPTCMDLYDVQRTASGSGPVTWNHDHTPCGIADLVGNMFEWVGGLRLLDGEFQIIDQNTAAVSDPDMLKPDCHWWRAISLNGALAAHRELDTLKVDGIPTGDNEERDHLIGAPLVRTQIDHRSYTGTHVQGNQAYVECKFCDLKAEEGLEVPLIAKILGFFPDETCTPEDGIFVARNYGERMAVRGGKAGSLDRAGLNALHFYNPRFYDGSATIGFRSAYVD